MTLHSFDLVLQHKALDLVLIACSSFTRQKTKFRLNQPLLSLQLNDQRESQKAPASRFPSTLFLKVSWLPRHQLPLQICENVALPNINLWDVTGLAPVQCCGVKGEGRACAGESPEHSLSQPSLMSHPSCHPSCVILHVSVPASMASIGSGNTPASLLPPCSAGFVQYLPPFNFSLFCYRLELFTGQKLSRLFSDF